MLKLWRLIALPVLLGFLLLGIYLYVHLGAGKEVVVDKLEWPQMMLVLKNHRGAYHKINAVIVEVEEWAKKNSIACPRTFGEYLDDPRQVAEERLNSQAGCIIESALDPKSLPQGFELKITKPTVYIHAVFTGSPAIGPWRVYPKLKEFAETTKLRTATSTIEIYTVLPDGDMKTDYLVPVLDPAQVK